MPQVAMVAAVVGSAVGVVGAVQSYNAQKKASAAQRKQQEAATRRERMQALRQLQIQRAQTMSSAVGAGASDSSGYAGGMASLTSQWGTDLGFGSQMSALSSDISKYSRQASMYSSLSKIGFGAASWGNDKQAEINKQKQVQRQPFQPTYTV